MNLSFNLNHADLRERAPVWLVFSLLALVPIGRLEELPLLVMAVLGGMHLWRERGAVFEDSRTRLLSVVFLAYWLPIVISCFDAAEPQKTWVLAATLPRFWLAGLFVITALARPGAHERLWRLTAWLLVIWSLDALLQAAVGYDVLGYPYPDERLNGVFGLHNYKLGPVLVLFSPLMIEHARRHWPPWLTATALATLVLVVLLTTTRIGWVMGAVVAATYFYMLARRRPKRALAAAGVLAVVLVVAAGLAYRYSAEFHQRMDSTLMVFRGTRGGLNEALSKRLPIWRTSMRMAEDHWINGVGARSYRYVYPDYALYTDPWVNDHGTGAAYAHQMFLEIATETGVIGLAGLVVMVVPVFLAWRRAPPERRRLMFPYLLGLGAALFPLNSHYAIYSVFWATGLWWLTMVFAAAGPPGERAPREL